MEKKEPPPPKRKGKTPAKKPRSATKPRPSDMPRRPLSAYNIFFKHTRGEIMAEREEKGLIEDPDIPPESRGANLFAQLGRTIAKRWKELSEEDLVQFKAMAKEDMKRYRSEMEEFNRRVAAKTQSDKERDALDDSLPSIALAAQQGQGDQHPQQIMRPDARQKPDILGQFNPELAQLEALQRMQSLQAQAIYDQNSLMSNSLAAAAGGTNDFLSRGCLGVGSTPLEQFLLQKAQLERLQLQNQLQQLQQGAYLQNQLDVRAQNNIFLEQALAASHQQGPSLSSSLGLSAVGLDNSPSSFNAGTALNQYMEEAIRTGRVNAPAAAAVQQPPSPSLAAENSDLLQRQRMLLQQQQLQQLEELLHRSSSNQQGDGSGGNVGSQPPRR